MSVAIEERVVEDKNYQRCVAARNFSHRTRDQRDAKKLEDLGFIEVYKGRRGNKISNKGREFLEKLD